MGLNSSSHLLPPPRSIGNGLLTVFSLNFVVDEGAGVNAAGTLEIFIARSSFRRCTAFRGGAVNAASGSTVAIHETTFESATAFVGGAAVSVAGTLVGGLF